MRIAVNGTQLYVDIEGAQLRVDGDQFVQRPTMLVLHGGPGFDQGYLRPGLAPLAASAQLVFVDLRGQGRSSPVDAATCTLEQMADDVAALTAELGVTAPIVFGHSAGGFVALHLALRHAALVGGLILCDTAPTLAPVADSAPPRGLTQRAPAEAQDVAGALFGGDFSPAIVDAFSRLVMPFYAGPGHEDIPGRIMRLSGFAADVAQHFFGQLVTRYDLRGGLSRIGVPALVIVGQEDWVCPPVYSRLLAAGIPSARLVEIPGAGHFPFAEDPEHFVPVVERFLMEVPVRGRPCSAKMVT